MAADRSHRRVPTLVAITAIAAVLVAIFIVMLTHSLQENDSYASIGSLLATIGTIIATVVVYLRREEKAPQVGLEADALALELLELWEPEIRHRRVRFGLAKTIPLSWVQLGGDMADAPTAIVGADPVPHSVKLKDLRLDGRLDDGPAGNPDRASRRLAEGFNQIPGKRLVVLGEPGAGKTFLAITLAVGLLRARVVGKPVPVFLSLSSWDPVADTLDDWMVRQLAATHYSGRERVPRALLRSRMLLPILDGLDELPEHLRRQAISRLNDVLEGDRSLVLTCRSTEYKDGLAGGAPVLLRAPVVEVRPVSTDDIAAHLRDNTGWVDIVAHVEQSPSGPVSMALSTPLVLSLFTAAYADRDPGELLTSPHLKNRHAIEDHLVDQLIENVYPADPEPTPWWRPNPWSTEKARAWLTYLAQYLHRHGERDFAWWRLSQRTLSPWTAAALALSVGTTAFFAGTAIRPWLYGDSYIWADDPVGTVLQWPPLLGMIFGLVVGLLWLASPRRTPGQTTNGSAFRRGAVAGLLLVLIPGAPLLLATPLGTGFQSVVTESALGGALIALAITSALAVGLHELMASRTKRIGGGSPEQLLRDDRKSALIAAGVTALFVGAFSWLTTIFAAALGGHMGQRIALALGKPTIADLNLPPITTHVPWLFQANKVNILITASVMLMVLFAIAVLTTRAWTRFLIARAVLAGGHRLPWRLMRFLRHAHQEGLLRRSGYSYQFWHVRLQERLVSTATNDQTGFQPAARHRRLALAGTFLLLTTLIIAPVWSAEPEHCRQTGWANIDHKMTRTTVDGASACIIQLTNDDWSYLKVASTDNALLNSARNPTIIPGARGPAISVSVFGELDQVPETDWHQLFLGMSTAQAIVPETLRIQLVYAKFDKAYGRDAFRIAAFYNREILGLPSSSTALSVQVDTDKSLINPSEEVIGLRDFDFATLAKEYWDQSIDAYLRAIDRTLTPANIADGISNEECAAIGDIFKTATSSSPTFDLRGTNLSTATLSRIASCGHVTLLVEKAYAESLKPAIQKGLETPLLSYFDDNSASIETDCRNKLGDSPLPKALAMCVTMLSLATGFREGVRFLNY